MRQTSTPSPDDRFEALWLRWGPRVMAYALRHTDPDVAQDVVSEVFLVAWRRLDSVPAEPLPWLLVVARNVISNQHRSRDRQGRVADELQRLRTVAEPAPAAEVLAGEREAMLQILAAMTAPEREALLLTAWDGLSPRQAAAVAGCSVPAFHTRLFRARSRLRQGRETLEPRPSPSLGGIE
ncbi:sigma-70 family RNA polymerase sigma factor [Kineosporia rhizophila]|uniref:RNA polymerase sigma factor n=1 Tax=Kineosporia rhizophila TaxID=84633 RepID=UPI001E4F0BF9|nr:sigma-70 family RNA polymerase sigma factor [Kineosporia rhizophila]